MKTSTLFFIMSLATILISCSGSDTYRGNWKATNEEESQLDIVFGKNDLTITENGDTKEYKYSQNSVSIKNSVETYGIQLTDGPFIQIHFPIGNDESKGAILDANGKPIYIISRNDYISYEDVFGLDWMRNSKIKSQMI